MNKKIKTLKGKIILTLDINASELEIITAVKQYLIEKYKISEENTEYLDVNLFKDTILADVVIYFGQTYKYKEWEFLIVIE